MNFSLQACRHLQGSPIDRDCELTHIMALQLQEGFLPQDSASISSQSPIRSNYPVARHDDADRIMTDRPANRLSRHPLEPALPCDSVGNPPVSHRFPKRHFAHDLSDTIAEVGACQMDSRKNPGVRHH